MAVVELPERQESVPAAPPRRRARHARVWVGVLLAASIVAAGAVASEQIGRPLLPLYPEGIAADPDGNVVALPVGTSAEFVPGTKYLVDDAVGPAAIEASRRWLASGAVPGRTSQERELAEQALLDLRLLTDGTGATVAAWRTAWQYVWPRDAAFVVTAFATTGHLDEASDVLRFLAGVGAGNGQWEARYLPDGSGLAPDCRVMQFDGAGWVPWAVWQWYVASERATGSAPDLDPYWPMLSATADAIVTDMGVDGLPSPSSDYIEHVENRLTLGVAAPLLLGLRSAADMAHRVGRTDEAERWDAAGQLLSSAIERSFGRRGYQRYLSATDSADARIADNGYPQLPEVQSNADSAVTFLAPPFADGGALVELAVDRTQRTLTLPNGGIKPVEQWRDDGVAWTPETALFALSAAARGDDSEARRLLAWLADHRTASKAIPEQVGPEGQPLSAAPLAWSEATVLLALLELDGAGIATPPVRGDPVVAPKHRFEPQDAGDPKRDECN